MSMEAGIIVSSDFVLIVSLFRTLQLTDAFFVQAKMQPLSRVKASTFALIIPSTGNAVTMGLGW